MTRLKMPKFDKDVFDPNKSSVLCRHVFSESEANKFIEYFYNYVESYPVLTPIIDLLKANLQFRAAITTDPHFADIRKTIKKPEDLQKIFDDMAMAIHSALIHSNNYEKNSTDHALFSSAIKYCLESIKQGVLDLRNTNDDIYRTTWQGSTLQTELKEHGIDL